MCVPLVVLALLGADLPGALDHTPGQAGAAVAVVRPPESIYYQVVSTLSIFGHNKRTS